MQCPYCKGSMVDGVLIGNNYKIKFMPDDKNFLLGIWAKDSIALGSKGIVGRAKVPDTWRCNQCNKMVIDLNNQ